jgi:conjugal transfer pilus assembly protein TraK
MNKTIITFLCLGLSSIQAAQIKTVKNYDEVHVQASITEPNTLLLEDDRIMQMKAPSNTLVDVCNGKPNCKLIDEGTGVLTFMPAPLYHTKTFTINVITEKGSFYSMRVEPKHISSQTILFKTYQKPVIKAQVPENSLYEQNIIHFFKEMMNGHVPEGFTQTVLPKPKVYKGRRTELRLVQTMTGNNLRGEIFELTNTSNAPLTVKEAWLQGLKVKGIVVESHHLAPRQSTRIYRVSNYVH